MDGFIFRPCSKNHETFPQPLLRADLYQSAPIQRGIRTMNLCIRAATLAEITTAGLIAELDTELQTRYPEECINGIEQETFAASDGYVAVAIADDEYAACGALSPLDVTTAELKRMYVRSAFRGCGIARGLLQHLETQAHQRGFMRIVLETGVRQPEALGLYSSVGYKPTQPFGPYRNSTQRLYLAKPLP